MKGVKRLVGKGRRLQASGIVSSSPQSGEGSWQFWPEPGFEEYFLCVYSDLRLRGSNCSVRLRTVRLMARSCHSPYSLVRWGSVNLRVDINLDNLSRFPVFGLHGAISVP
jgi:hypothetical protein